MAKRAIVTGGTRGIGAAISRRLQKEGYQVIANYGANDRVAETFHLETGIEVLKWDVSDPEASFKALSDVQSRLGGIDIVVNNAGITRDRLFHKMSYTDWHSVIQTNLGSLFHTTNPLWEGMRERQFGRIVCISSVNAQKGQMGQVNYCAAKAGELGFVKALALEGARYGITVNAICPGYIGTEMVQAIAPDVLASKILPFIPVGRLGTPEEIARCVAFLVADEASFITGSTLSVNGGQMMAS